MLDIVHVYKPSLTARSKTTRGSDRISQRCRISRLYYVGGTNLHNCETIVDVEREEQGVRERCWVPPYYRMVLLAGRGPDRLR
jgi:hypothetical protein